MTWGGWEGEIQKDLDGFSVIAAIYSFYFNEKKN